MSLKCVPKVQINNILALIGSNDGLARRPGWKQLKRQIKKLYIYIYMSCHWHEMDMALSKLGFIAESFWNSLMKRQFLFF